MASFVDTWKTVKTKFETDTGKRKPDAKFLGVIRKGSGIESALKTIDALIAKQDWDALPAAQKDFAKAQTAYIEEAKSAAMKQTEYKALSSHINDLVNALRKIGDDISDEVKQKAGSTEVTLETLIGKGNCALLTKGAAIDAAVTGFLQAKVFVNAVSGIQDAPLLQLKERADRHLKAYSTALERCRNARSAKNQRTPLLRFAKDQVGDMLDAVGKNGLLGVITEYSRHQGEALKKAGKGVQDSPLVKLAAKAAVPLNGEFNNLTKVEAFLDNIKG